MDKRIKGLAFTLLIGTAIGLLAGGGITSAVAQFTSPPDSHGVMFLANHHKELNFTLGPNDSKTITLPKRDCPVIFAFVVGNIISGGQLQPPVCFQIQNAVTAPPSNVGFLGSACRKGVDLIMTANPDGSITIQTAPPTCFPGSPLDSNHLNVCVSMWY